VHQILRDYIEPNHRFKFYLNLQITFERIDGSTEYAEFYTWSAYIYNRNDIDAEITNAIANLRRKVDEFIRKGSGYRILQIGELRVNLTKIKRLYRGRSYMELPDKLKGKKSVLNVQNEDSECFRWSVLAKLFPVGKNGNRVTKYKPHYDDIKFPENYKPTNGEGFPAHGPMMDKFERLNNLSVNVFTYHQKDGIEPLRISKVENTDDRHVDLLLLDDEEKTHYVLIKNLNGFLREQWTDKDHTRHFCRYCLWGFSNEQALHNHRSEGMCTTMGTNPKRIKLPSKDKCFKTYTPSKEKESRFPYVIYADFESILAAPDPKDKKCGNKTRYQVHRACSFAYTLIGLEKTKIELYRGPDAAEKFVKMVRDDVRTILNSALCKERLKHIPEWKRKVPVFIHNLKGYDSHLIMQEIGKVAERVSCIAQSSEKFVSFEMDGAVFKDSFSFLGSSLEKLAGNLVDKEAKDAAGQIEKFKITKKHHEGLSAEQLRRLCDKGVYPYDATDSFADFDKTAFWEEKEFYSKLNEESCKHDDYLRAKGIYEDFKCRNRGEYSDLYLKTDVLLLSDVFENFRSLCLQKDGLDPAMYYTLPGYSWDVCLKQTGVKLQLFNDDDDQLDMLLFTEKGIRGGISMISNRYGRANNPYMKEHYDREEAIENGNKYIMYWDANALYSYAMCKPLPTGGYKWVGNDELKAWNDSPHSVLNSKDVEAPKGYMLEVDLEYQQHLHDRHNDYPCAPEQTVIGEEDLSPYSKHLKTIINACIKRREMIDSGVDPSDIDDDELAETVGLHQGNVPKLVCRLTNKSKYVVHYRTLQRYVQLGLRVTKVHRVLEFDQSPWMKPYIEGNIKNRIAAKNDFEKDFYKLKNNAVFGKTMENVRKRKNVELLTLADKDRLEKLIRKPNFQTREEICSGLLMVHSLKQTLVMDKPIIIGAAILDISKDLMYDFHYNVVKARYGDGAKLLFTDTDSLCYEITTEDVYRDLATDDKFRSWFDCSPYCGTKDPETKGEYNYVEKYPKLADKSNKGIVGKFKDDLAEKYVMPTEFVGLRAKMYSIDSMAHKTKATAKGIKKKAAERIRHKQYINCLFGKNDDGAEDVESRIQMAEFNVISSKKHIIYTERIRKISLCSADDKFYMVSDTTKYAYGHYAIQQSFNTLMSIL
jgi:hypothetical protein